MTRVRSWTFWIAGGVAVYLMLCLLGMAARASAEVVTTAGVDPVAIATASTDSGWSLVSQYGWFWGGSLLLLGLGRALLKGNAASHWIAQGRTLAVIAGVLGVLGSVAEWHFNGAPAAGILITLVMAAKLVWQPAAPEATK